MQALWAVYKRELALYFRSFIAYAVAFALIGFVGLFFIGNISFALQSQMINQSSGVAAADLITLNLNIVVFLMFLIAPLLTMRLISEESREGTLEVLMTLPMGEWVFVVGKFLAAWTYYTVLLALTGIHLLLVSFFGPVNEGLVFSMYFGAWLYGGAAIAVSLIWSAITEDQLVAAFLGAASLLALFLAESLAIIVSDQRLIEGASDFVRQLGFTSHYQSTMMVGILRAQDVAYFVMIIVIALFITTLLVGSRRWRAA